MERARLNYIIDILMLISFIVTAVTALVIFFFLPSGIRQGSYQEFLGIIKSNWAFIHNWSGIAFIVLVIVHFILHWKWVINMTKNILR